MSRIDSQGQPTLASRTIFLLRAIARLRAFGGAAFAREGGDDAAWVKDVLEQLAQLVDWMIARGWTERPGPRDSWAGRLWGRCCRLAGSEFRREMVAHQLDAILVALDALGDELGAEAGSKAENATKSMIEVDLLAQFDDLTAQLRSTLNDPCD